MKLRVAQSSCRAKFLFLAALIAASIEPKSAIDKQANPSPAAGPLIARVAMTKPEGTTMATISTPCVFPSRLCQVFSPYRRPVHIKQAPKTNATGLAVI